MLRYSSAVPRSDSRPFNVGSIHTSVSMDVNSVNVGFLHSSGPMDVNSDNCTGRCMSHSSRSLVRTQSGDLAGSELMSSQVKCSPLNERGWVREMSSFDFKRSLFIEIESMLGVPREDN